MATRKLKKSNLRDKKKVAEDLTNINGLSAIETIEQIVKMAEDCKLTDTFFKKVSPFLQHLGSKQGITESQALFLSLFVERSSAYRNTDLSDVAEILDCRAVSILKYQSQLDALVKAHFLKAKKDYNERFNYYVPKKVIEALTNDVKFERESYKCKDTMEFLEKFYEFTHEYYHDEISHEIMMDEIKLLFEENEELKFVLDIRKYDLDEMDEILLTHFCRHLVVHNHEILETDNLTFFYEKDRIRRDLAEDLEKGRHILQRRKLIEYSFEDGFEDKEHFRLTESARKKLLKDFKLKTKRKTVSDIISSKNIVEKSLFYDGKTVSQVNELEGLLSEENFKNVRSRMKAQKMRCGFACVFYGSPGTGKTETVLQLARKTGRDILQVNISEVKSMWVGESEKNIKAIFDRYRTQAQNAKITPILLFNEADAVIGKRREGAESAVDKMENSIQNIILQEMETLDGIMIATTNLEQNMDKAFERRFLYKIKFNKPSLEARSNIWKTMIPALSEDESTALASKYDFSGGQIENIARHYAINTVLHGDDADRLASLFAYCDGEKFEQKECRKIGFV
jgi:SpoVK/Ycf46/Vps4 family AAA+-type ATPase